jgi:hypothetical protein
MVEWQILTFVHGHAQGKTATPLASCPIGPAGDTRDIREVDAALRGDTREVDVALRG